MELSKEITIGVYDEIQQFLTANYPDLNAFLTDLDSRLQAQGFDQEERDFASSAISSAPDWSAWFTGDLGEVVAATATAASIGGLKDLANSVRPIIQKVNTNLTGVTLGDAIEFTFDDIATSVAAVNKNLDPKILNKAKALAIAGGALALSFMVSQVVLSDTPQSEAVKLGVLTAAGYGAFTAAKTGLLFVSPYGALPTLVVEGVSTFASVLSVMALNNAWDDVFNTASQLEAMGISPISIYNQLSDTLNSKIEEAFDEAGAAAGALLLEAEEFLGNLGALALNFAVTDVDALPTWITDDVLPDMGVAETTISPLVLDLDGDGVELAALNGAGSVYWDLDQDGFAEAAGWVAGGDGLLALDRDGDGAIGDHSELFGTESIDGFDMLAELDSNADGKINAADSQFDSLLVWRDDNADGISQAGELFSLNDLNITEIDLAASASSAVINGNPISRTSTFTMDGATQEIVDAWFAYDNVNATFVGDVTLNPETLFLPTLRGYGALPDLHIAMSQDQTLLDLVKDVALEDPATLFAPTFDVPPAFMIQDATRLSGLQPGRS